MRRYGKKVGPRERCLESKKNIPYYLNESADREKP